MDKLYEDMMDDILADYGIVDEAKRIKGKEYNKLTSYATDVRDTEYSKDNVEKIGSTSLGKSVIDSSVQKYISNINVEKEKKIVQSENILEEYSAYVFENINSAIGRYADNDSKSRSHIEKIMVEEIAYLQKNGFSNTDINGYLLGNYYGFDEIAKKLGYRDAIEFDEEGQNDKETTTKISNIIRSMLKLRLNYVNKIIQLLSQMIQANYKQLGLSEQQMKVYLDSLSKGDNSSTKTTDEIYNKIRENSEQYEINGGEGYDFRKLGFGCIFGPSNGIELKFAGTDGSNKDAMLSLIQSVMRYDAVVVDHGGENKKSYEGIDPEELQDAIWEEIKKLDDKSGEIRDFIANPVKEEILYRLHMDDNDNITSAFNKAAEYIINNITSLVITDVPFRFDMDINKYKSHNVKDIAKDIVNMTVDSEKKEYMFNNTGIHKLTDIIVEGIEPHSKQHSIAIRRVVDEVIGLIETPRWFILRFLSKDDNNKDIIINACKNMANRMFQNYWSCQPTKTLNGGPFEEVNELVRQLIKEGFKKIKIEDCNPGHHKLADDIMKTKGVLINYSDFSNYVESGELYSNDPSLQYLIEVENDLKSLALEYDIDYNNDEYLEECMQWYNDNYEVIQEGVWDSLKEFTRKVIGAIIGFFKKIVGYVRTAITKAKELIFGSKEKPKNTKSKTPKVKTKMINLSSKKIDEFISESREDLDKVWKSTSDTIAKEIKRQSDIQAKLSKALEEDLKKVGVNPEQSVNKESSGMFDVEKNIKDDLDRVYENSIVQKFKWLFGNSIDEATLPGVNNDDDEDNDFTVGGTDDDTAITTTDNTNTATTDDNEEDNDFAVADAGGDEDTDNTDDNQGEDNIEDTEGNDTDEGEDDYTLPDAGEDEEGTEGDEVTEDDDNNFDVNDAGGGEDDTNTDDNDTDPTTGGADGDLIGGNGSGEDVSDDVQIPNLRDVQQKLFDQLTPEQQQIKVDELKKNYADLYSRCANILKIITDSNPGDDNTVKVFDYVQKTMNDLQTHIYYYIANTFDTKTYIENDIQFKQFITILHTIKKILDEINGSGSNMDIEKKE